MATGPPAARRPEHAEELEQSRQYVRLGGVWGGCGEGHDGQYAARYGDLHLPVTAIVDVANCATTSAGKATAARERHAT